MSPLLVFKMDNPLTLQDESPRISLQRIRRAFVIIATRDADNPSWSMDMNFSKVYVLAGGISAETTPCGLMEE